MDIDRDRHRERTREHERDRERDKERDKEREREHKSRDRERGERTVPEWRMADEREGRRRAEAELAEMRQKLDAALAREDVLRQDTIRLEEGTKTAQARAADFESKFGIAQRELAHAEEARRLLLGHNGSALRGTGADIIGGFLRPSDQNMAAHIVVNIDIVRSLERQFATLGEELTKERNLRQIAEDALNNTQRGVGILGSNLPGASSSTGFASGFGSGEASALGAGGLNGSALSALAGTLGLAGLVPGQESQLATNLLKALVEQSVNSQVNGKLSS